VVEPDILRALDDVVEFISALPLYCDDNPDLFEEVITRKVKEAAPTLVQRWPVLLTLLAAKSTEEVIETIADLAVRAKCSMMYLTLIEKSRLSEAGLSLPEQLLLGRLRERLKNEEGSH